jgi:hypothetical protein
MLILFFKKEELKMRGERDPLLSTPNVFQRSEVP